MLKGNVKTGPVKTGPARLLATAMLQENSAAYLDDVIIFSETWSDHLAHVRRIFQPTESSSTHRESQKVPVRNGTVPISGACCW